MDNGAFLGALALPLLLAVVIGLVVAVPLVLTAADAGLNHVLGAIVRTTVDALRSPRRTLGDETNAIRSGIAASPEASVDEMNAIIDVK